MAHAEHEYKFIDIGGELMTNPPAQIVSEHAKQGWEVQQVFVAALHGQAESTFVLLRRKYTEHNH